MNPDHKFISLIYVLLLLPLHYFGQFGPCNTAVTHTQGIEYLSGTRVQVTHSGYAVAHTEFCGDSYPYGIGVAQTGNNGSFTFSFTPALSLLSLNFIGLSNINAHIEETWLYKNGQHYAIPQVGLQNCGQFANLTPTGDIIACQQCSNAGWDNVILNGPISSLTVLDTVLSGNPNGILFSLYICSNPVSIKENSQTNKAYQFIPNPFSQTCVLKTPPISNLHLLLYNESGKLFKEIFPEPLSDITFSKEELPNGIYYYILRNNSDVIASGKIISD